MSNRWKVAQWNDLPRFVMTLDQAISEILDPPLLSTWKDKGPDAVAGHIYERLSQRGIHYTWERRSWGKEQEVRTPTEVITTHQGTCLDLALLFAACLEAQFVHPIVVILDGHALVAFWRGYYGEEKLPPVPRKNSSSQPAVLAAATVGDLLQRNQIVPVECTGFALFDRPVTLAPTFERHLRTRKFPLADRPEPPQAPGDVASDKLRLIAYDGAKSLGTTQIQNSKVQYGVCIATARNWEILPMRERDALFSLWDREVMPGVPSVLHNGGSASSPRLTFRKTFQHIVGRQEEMRVLDDVITGKLPPVVNIYGPGGIGKTVVCHKFAEECDKQGIPYAMVTGSDQAASVIGQMLSQFTDDLEKHVPKGVFEEFTQQFRDHAAINALLEKVGGPDKLFNWAGNPLPRQIKRLLDTVVGDDRDRLASYLAHRGTLERYIGNVEHRLTASFIEGVTRVVEDGQTHVVLLVDTYERLGGLDEWMCETFVKALPPEAKVILLGRDILSGPNHDWSQYDAATLKYHELRELSEQEAKDYLGLHDLHDEKALNGVYKFTRGYPLCLALAVDLSRQLRGGWEEVRGLADPGYQDHVARELLNRILRQEAVEEVRAFLEKGVVTEWFDAGLVSCILEDDNPERGQKIYEKLSTFSFVHPHPQGLQFHDTVREILKVRLQRLDNGKTYRHLATKCRKYLNARAGIGKTARPRQR